MLKRWLERLQQTDAQAGPLRRQVACAVLLLECARADFDHQPVELQAVREALGAHFGIGGADLENLIAQAGREAEQSISLHDYVARLNGELSAEDKAAVMDMLWRVAYADGRLDPQEEALIRRLAELLYVPHAQFVRSKLAVAGQT
jgi:uncharacterized tellurite resistance protein B-like protein